MAGQDQLVPLKPQPVFQVSPLVPQPAVTGQQNAGMQPAVQSGQPQQSQGQEVASGSATGMPSLVASADVGAGLLANIFQTNEQTAAAEMATMKANNAIDDSAQTAINQAYEGAQGAFENMTRIKRWEGSGLTEVLGLFDSDWNAGVQEMNLKATQLKITQIEDRAKTMKAINERTPELSKLAGNLAKANYDAFGKGLDLEIKGMDARIRAEQENRTAQVAAVDRLPIEGVRSALKQAKAGKGDYVGLEGLLEHRIDQEEKADLELDNLRLNMQEKRMDLADKSMRRFASYLPVNYLQTAVTDAMQKNQASIMVNAGKKGKFEIPLPLAQQVLQENIAREDNARKAVAVRVAAEAQLPETINQILASTSAMATVDPRAGHELGLVSQVAKGINPNDVNSVRQGIAFLDASKARIKTITEEVAKTYEGKDAQQAIINYGATGTFTDVGGQAVVKATIGNFGVQKSSKYNTAWDAINTAVASKLSAQGAGGMDWQTSEQGGSYPTDTAMVMAMLSQNKSKLSSSTIVDQVLSDPAINQQVINAISDTVKPNALITTIQSLASGENSDPIWKQLLANPSMMSVDGALDVPRLIETLEQQSVTTGYKANYVNVFKDKLRRYGTEADMQASQDPSYTISDRALEARYFGSRPQSAIVADLYKEVDVVGRTTAAEMRKRIQSDLTGQTETNAGLPAATQAALSDTGGFGMPGGWGPNSAQQINQVPSSTGAKLTTQQVRSLFGNGR